MAENTICKKEIITFEFLLLDTYFMVGTGSKPSPYGIKIPDEEGSLAPLKTYRHKSVLLTLPPTIDVSAIDWFSVWSQSLQMSLGEVKSLHFCY